MTLQLVPVHPSMVEAVEGVTIDIPAVAYVGVDDGEIVGSYGLAWGRGRCWIWLQMQKQSPAYGLAIFRQAKALIRKAWQLGEREVFTPRDAQYPTSEKLLTKLGFRMFAIEEGVEVWVYERI